MNYSRSPVCFEIWALNSDERSILAGANETACQLEDTVEFT